MTGFSVAINSTSDGIDFTNIPTIYSGESVSVTYNPGSTGNVNRITDTAGNELATFTQSISNSSSQTSGPPGDNSGPDTLGNLYMAVIKKVVLLVGYQAVE